MAANDPTTRREAASTAARARVAGMTDDQRRDMTRPARDALRQRDERHVDNDARRRRQFPLDHATREFRIGLRVAARAAAASKAAGNARARRQALVTEILRETAARR